ncbi:hypothetical protein BDZ89DRAFT_1155358 [Hymenopellis radicata]|nr:hypothetical protein BDZ89DRAFT_1155358 [Hymenopellis radicata]
MSTAKGNAYASGEQVKAALRSQDVDVLTKALVLLRNQLSFGVHEVLAPQDRRLILVQQWLTASPAAQDVFSLWETAEPRQTAFISLVISILATTLSLLTIHYPNHSFGHPIVKKLLEPTYTRVLKGYIGGANHDLILNSLKLYNSISNFASGRERRAVLEVFPWELKSLPKLMNMRRKNKVDDPLDKPDIRTLYILLMLSFIETGSSTSTKALFLEQRRDAFTSLFKGLHQDPYVVIRRVLEACWSGMWGDSKLKRTLKIAIFNEVTLTQLCKIYDRVEEGDDDVPADVVHHFLLAICTHPGSGVCFKDHGWYPREIAEDQRPFIEKDETTVTKGKVYNKILGNVLKNLKANEDLRQQELVIKILEACPELVASYWTGAGLTLEPRLSTRWFTNIALFGSIISLPVPVSSFLLAEKESSGIYQPNPPPLSNVIENIFPTSLGKGFLTKALQPNSRSLVQHSSALALCKCLVKSRRGWVMGEAHTRLGKRGSKRIPEFQVILAFSQRTNADAGIKKELLAESSHRLLWLYHRFLPELASEARFDVGKLLTHFVTTPEDIEASGTAHLDTLKQLHILGILEASDQFAWTAKYGAAKHSSLYILLRMFIDTPVPVVHSTLSRLIQHLLPNSILFQHSTDEVELWLVSLPTTKRSPSAEAPDGTPLTDEGEGVLVFLDECIQRCLKTPYRYIEEMKKVAFSHSYPSPLLMTVKEQLAAKLGAKTLTASDTLSLATFIRKLVFRLHTTDLDGSFIRCYVEQIDSILSDAHLFPDFVLVTGAIRREVEIMQYCTRHLSDEIVPPPVTVAKDVREFLTAVEKLEPPAADVARAISAFELVDWLRLIDESLRSSEIMRLILIVNRYHEPALKELIWATNPKANLLWDGPTPVEEIQRYATFDWLFVSSSAEQLADKTRRSVLVEAAVAPGVTLASMKRVVCQIEHSLNAALVTKSSSVAHLLDLINDIVVRSSEALGADHFALKEYVFVHSPSIRSLSITQALFVDVREALRRLVHSNLRLTDREDRRLVTETALNWKHEVESDSADLEHASIWIPFLSIDALLDLSVTVGETAVAGHATSRFLSTMVDAIRARVLQDELVKISFTNQLMRLRSKLPDMSVIDDVLAPTLAAMQPMFVDGRGRAGCAGPEVLKCAETQWNLRLRQLPGELQLLAFLEQKTWTTGTVDIIRALLYKTDSAASFSTWLQTGNYRERPYPLLVRVLRAHLDSTSCLGRSLPDAEHRHWVHNFRNFSAWCADTEGEDVRHHAASCLILLFPLLANLRAELSAVLVDSVATLPVTSLPVDLLKVGRALGSECPSFVDALVEHGAQWAVRRFSDYDSFDSYSESRVEGLIELIESASSLKPHIIEPFLTVIPQKQLSNPLAVKLLNAVLLKTQFKPLIINRALQTIVQHHRFTKICSVTSVDESYPALRDRLVQLLHILFHLHPSNTCQITHILPLLPIYYGTISISDRRLLSIFRLFESQRKTSIAVLFEKWDASPDGTSNNSLEAIRSLDSNMLHRTCLQFPKWRVVEDQSAEYEDAPSTLYDPIFVILLFVQMLADSPPTSAFAWIELFRTNIVGVLIRALSAKDDHVRELGLCAIAGLWTSLEGVDLQERLPVQHILALLRNAIPPPAPNEPFKRLPTFTTLLLSHALRSIFYPYQFMYPITARFLLQRPEIDTSDVPMLFGLLYSSSDEWRRERTWMIHLLSDGLVGSDDWKVFKRRHTWDLLASIFQSSPDRALRRSIFEVLVNLTCIPQAVSSLVLKSGLLPWIEMQVMHVCDDETVLWLKVLENVIITLDAQKVEANTNGQWRYVLGRCLSHILRCPSSANPSVLSLTVRVLLRLSLLQSPLPEMRDLLEKAFSRLQETEKSPESWPDSKPSKAPLRVPHVKGTLSECPADEWGQVVESLWRISMSLSEKTVLWDRLSCRLLLTENGDAASWVRAEAVKNLSP